MVPINDIQSESGIIKNEKYMVKWKPTEEFYEATVVIVASKEVSEEVQVEKVNQLALQKADTQKVITKGHEPQMVDWKEKHDALRKKYAELEQLYSEKGLHITKIEDKFAKGRSGTTIL